MNITPGHFRRCFCGRCILSSACHYFDIWGLNLFVVFQSRAKISWSWNLRVWRTAPSGDNPNPENWTPRCAFELLSFMCFYGCVLCFNGCNLLDSLLQSLSVASLSNIISIGTLVTTSWLSNLIRPTFVFGACSTCINRCMLCLWSGKTYGVSNFWKKTLWKAVIFIPTSTFISSIRFNWGRFSPFRSPKILICCYLGIWSGECISGRHGSIRFGKFMTWFFGREWCALLENGALGIGFTAVHVGFTHTRLIGWFVWDWGGKLLSAF